MEKPGFGELRGFVPSASETNHEVACVPSRATLSTWSPSTSDSKPPFASAFLGHKVGDVVEVNVPAGKMTFELTKIER